MRILIIDNSIAFTGAFKCALNEATVLSGNHSFHFLLPDGTTVIESLKEHSMGFSTLPMREISRSASGILTYPFHLVRNLIRLKRLLREQRIDVIQVNDFYNLLGAAAKLSGFRGKLLIYVRFLPASLPSILAKLWIRAARLSAGRLIAVSDAVLKQLPPYAGAVRIYDPVLLAETLPSKDYNEGSGVHFIYLANYTRGKGQEYAIEAFAKVYAQNPDVRLSFIGGDMGLTKNAAFRSFLERRVQALGLGDVVKCCPFEKDVEALIKAASVVLNFSDGESFSMTCLEAAFYGTCIIATKCGGPEEIIIHEQTGLLVEKGNIPEMANAMSALASDSELRRRYGMAGRLHVKQKFSIESYRSQIEKVLNS